MGHKAVERAHIISNALGLVTDKEHTALISAVVVQEVLQRSQESWRWGVSWPAIEYDNDQLRAIIKSDTLTTSGEVDKKKTHHWPFYGCLAFEANCCSLLARWKRSISGRPKILKKEKHYFEVSSFLTLHNNGQFLHRIVTCDKKWMVYSNQWWQAKCLDWE